MRAFSKRATQGSEQKSNPNKVERTFVPTKEQEFGKNLVTEEMMIKFGACAGSGKSSSLYYFARCNPVPSLGLVFNKTMAEEATRKSPDHVDWMTTHSLAYRTKGKMFQHKLSRLKGGRYVNVAVTGTEIAIYFRLPDFHMNALSFISKNYVGLIVKDTVAAFEISADFELERKHVPFHHIKDLEKRYGKDFPKKKFTDLVFRRAKELWEERIDPYSDVLMNHNTYLKLYHLSKPDLSKYKIIYVDEAQDINPVTMAIIRMQEGKCKIVWVGDKYQGIYGFNGAVNAMEKIECKEAYLTKSFRFGQAIADVAKMVLRYKMEIVGNEDIDSVASREDYIVDRSKPYTLLFRTNMELIFQAVKMITDGQDVNVNVDLKDFVAMIKSAQELHQGNLKKVKHEEILPFTTWNDLVEESKHIGELSRCVSIVEGDEVDRMVKILHNHKNSRNAHVTVTSAHKAKGLEWEQVILGDDFPSNYDHKGRFVGLKEQEENLLYVAVTRAEKVLQFNSTVEEFFEIDAIPSDKFEGLKVGNMKVQTLSEAESEMYFNDGLVTPLGDHSQDAVNRGMEEYFSPMTCDDSGEVVPHGMSMNDFDSPMDAEGIEQDLKLWSARL
ncbi:P-loop containing nucleoside triphosphate hydrolase [Vibrio phage 1.187.O._10N.286.49.F1]|nr:P-loop containing nucleoside triphosphate hydrolase [Vibrio phage 1.187.O._10N.286.49.F1]